MSRRHSSLAFLVGFSTFAATLWLAACRKDPPPAQQDAAGAAEISIAAASDLKFAMDEIIARFRTDHPAATLKVSYGSSGNFYAQLTNRAPFDIFLSADMEYPKKLIEAGLAVRGSEFQYALGRIVVWTRSSSPIDVQNTGLKALLHPSVRKISIANPAHAPYGRAAEAAMKTLGVYEQVQSKLVLGDNISQAAQFVESGSADIGIIALSLALGPAMRDHGKYTDLPNDSYPRLEQGGAIMSWCKNPALASQFRVFLISQAGQAILRKYGFFLPPS